MQRSRRETTIIHRRLQQKTMYGFLKKSLAFSQALPISNICTETNQLAKHIVQVKEVFVKSDYQKTTKDDRFNILNRREQQKNKRS